MNNPFTLAIVRFDAGQSRDKRSRDRRRIVKFTGGEAEQLRRHLPRVPPSTPFMLIDPDTQEALFCIRAGQSIRHGVGARAATDEEIASLPRVDAW